MIRFVTVLAALLCMSAAPHFEVATVRPSPPGGRGGGIRPAPGGERYIANNIPLRMLIWVAYQVKADQVVGGPSWIDTDNFDMNAKAERPSTTDELHAMLQSLLAERFQLRFHRDTKELPMYALTSTGGSALQPRTAASAGEQWIDQSVDQVVQVRMKARVATMSYFAWRLSQLLDRPVVDVTGLTGTYDFELAYTRDLPPGMNEGTMLNGSPVDTSGPTVFEALRRQLGLKLSPQRGPVETIVVDHAEKPVE